MKTLAIAALLAASSVAVAQDAVEWRLVDGGNGHWYSLRPKVGNWQQCRDEAMALGADLASIGSAAENAFIEPMIPRKEFPVWNRVFLGGRQMSAVPPTEGWSWSDGSGWSFTDWADGQPNGGEGYLVAMRDEDGPAGCFWGDYGPDSSDIYFYLAEWSEDCNGDGIVDFGQIRSGVFTDANVNGIPDCCEGKPACELQPIEWPTSQGGNGHWYRLNQALLNWQDAQDAAASLGGHLATATSHAESDFLLSIVGPPLEPWIGGYQDLDAPDYVESAGGWRWVTGEPWEFTLWGINQPNGEAAENNLTFGGPYQGQWNDLGGWVRRPSIVEWSADCNGDGVVDLGQIRSGELADANGNNIPDCCESGACSPCQGDVTGNGTVDGVDLAAMLGAWGTNGQGEFETDVNEDGFVDGADLAILLGGWGDC